MPKKNIELDVTKTMHRNRQPIAYGILDLWNIIE